MPKNLIILPIVEKYKIQNTKYRLNKGFSLVELMLAMVLLSIVIFGVVKLQTSNLTVSNTNKNELQANFYANQGMEIVKGLGYAALCAAPCDTYITYTTSYGLGATGTDPIPDPFERTIKVEDVGLTDAYKVTSIIEWTDSTGTHDLSGGAVMVSRIIF